MWRDIDPRPDERERPQLSRGSGGDQAGMNRIPPTLATCSPATWICPGEPGDSRFETAIGR